MLVFLFDVKIDLVNDGFNYDLYIQGEGCCILCFNLQREVYSYILLR